MSNAVKVTYPNRDKSTSRATRAAVVALQSLSAALVVVISVGGWSKISGGQLVQLGFAAIFVVLALYVLRWKRGALPITAAAGAALLALALVGGPAWFDRNQPGFDSPVLNENLLGLLTLSLVPLQLLLIFFAFRGFQQGWNIELDGNPTGNP